MAKALNKNRMILSRLAIIVILGIILGTRETFADSNPVHEILDILGVTLVGICAIGRVYCTAFLGGHKNKNLVTYGPFSVVRNPLYVFSLIGVLGISLMSNHIVLIVGLPLAFYLMYVELVKREEGFLREAFGAEYVRYCATTSRFMPQFSNYAAPDEVVSSPKQMWHGARDACVWFVPYMLFEGVEYIRYLFF